MKVRFYGDILYSGVIEVEVEDLEEAKELASRDIFNDEEIEFAVYDRQNKFLAFIPSGEILDENGDEIDGCEI